MSLTADQMARLDRLLDEALDLDQAERELWLRQLSEADQDLLPLLRDALLQDPANLRRTLPRVVLETGSREFAPRQRVGPYELIRQIGRGGMAQVWLARRADGAYEREVALKLPVVLRLRGDVAQRFARERDILAALEHPHIARFYDAGMSADGLPYLALEYVPGKSLVAWCDARKLGVSDRVRLFLDVLEAVRYAHERGVLHRDIKPSNVLVTEDGQVRLLDFGVARMLQETDSPLTRIYGLALTPEYASPEQIEEKTLEPASDIYSLGVLLYELLAGRLPYRLQGNAVPRALPAAGAPSTRVDEEAALSRGTRGSQLARALKGDLDAIVLKALAPDPDRRYRSAAALASDLQRYLDGMPVLARGNSPAYRIGKRIARHPLASLATAGALLAALLGGAWTLVAPQDAPQRDVRAPAADEKSIAVLPFVDMSEKKDQEYLSDGLSEELIDRLSHVPELKVIARTSSFQFKGRNEDMRTIAAKLGVAHLLEGSVRKDGNSLRITAQLIRASDGSHVWSQSYDRGMSGIFKLQDEIAATVAKSLKVAMNAGPQDMDTKTPSTEAYSLVLKGRFHLFRLSREDHLEAIELLRQALEFDPNYALAWALLGNAYFGQATFGWAPRAEALDRSRQALARALKIDPALFSAHFTLAAIAANVDWDWDAARREIARMREINPGDGIFLPFMEADLALVFGRLGEAIAKYHAILARDPLYTYGIRSLGWSLYLSQRYEESIAAEERLLQVSPAIHGAHWLMATSWIMLGKYDRAREEIAKEPGEDDRLQALATIDWAQGRRAESDAELQALETKFGGRDPYAPAAVHAFRGETDAAFSWLDRSLRQHQSDLTFAASDPYLRNLRGDARFREVLAKLGLAAAFPSLGGARPGDAPAAAP
jgi:serine/threonine protein kinase